MLAKKALRVADADVFDVVVFFLLVDATIRRVGVRGNEVRGNEVRGNEVRGNEGAVLSFFLSAVRIVFVIPCDFYTRSCMVRSIVFIIIVVVHVVVP